MEPEQQNMNMGPDMGAESKGGSAGPIIGIIVILAIIIFGGLYFWGQRSGSDAMMEDGDAMMEESDSDTTSSIEADLESTNIEDLDAELNAS